MTLKENSSKSSGMPKLLRWFSTTIDGGLSAMDFPTERMCSPPTLAPYGGDPPQLHCADPTTHHPQLTIQAVAPEAALAAI